MSLDVGTALRDGIDRTFARSGLLLMAVFLLLRAATAVASDTVNRANLRLLDEFEGELPPEFVEFVPGPQTMPFALDVGLPEALLLVLVVAVLAEAVRIVGVRTLVSDRMDAIPREYVERNIGFATLNGFVGGIVVWVLIAVGLVFLVVPGIFLAIAFFFVRQVIAVEDANFVEAMAESWRLTAGDRLELFALALVVVVVGFVASLFGGILVPDPALSRGIDVVIGAVTTVFGMAVAARAYVQLREADEEEDLTQWEGLES